MKLGKYTSHMDPMGHDILTLRIQICPKKGSTPAFLFKGWDWNPQSYSGGVWILRVSQSRCLEELAEGSISAGFFSELPHWAKSGRHSKSSGENDVFL